ncbi:protein of unknown function [Prevotellaceae bacterium KH2P17]|nr:protein of unknown function [Prevotellaceae bacterium KH2P17]
MKSIKYIFSLLMAAGMLTACSDDDSPSAGSPVVTSATEQLEALMGDSISFTANCSNQAGVSLSTLKAELYYDGERVSEQTIRTKTEGDYSGRLSVPYFPVIPNGTAELRLTLQDVSMATAVKSIPVSVRRPEFAHISFVSADGNTYTMTPDADDPYQFSAHISTPLTVFRGYFRADAASPGGQPLTFGWDGTAVAINNTGNISFNAEDANNVTVTFNTRYFTYGPQYVPSIALLLFDTDGEAQLLDMVQGRSYRFEGNDAMTTDEWYYDPDYLTPNADGSFTFNVISGRYSFMPDFGNKYFRIHPVAADGSPLTAQLDGSGCIWIIGSAGINKPTWQAVNHGWWTGVENDLALAPIGNKKYQVTLTVGKQLNAADVDFKFFGQPNWGVEFGSTTSNFYLTTDNPYFQVGAADGNIKPAEGATLTDGETYVFTIDCSAGFKPATLTVVKK